MMKSPLLSALLPMMLFATPMAANAEGFANLLRSVTNAIGGSAAPTQPSSGVTPVIGVRGIDDDGVPTTTAGSHASAEIKSLDNWAETAPGAEAAAAKRGLAARNVSLAEEGKP